MGGWGEYLLAAAAFMGAHVLPALPRPRAFLIARLGRRVYLAGFSLLSILLIWWLIAAAGRAPVIALWDQTPESRWLVNIAMPLAILCAALATGLSGLVAAFAIWSGAHLAANGDLAHVLFFGGMLAFAISGLVRSGPPRRFRVTPLRLALAGAIWMGLLGLHPLVVGVSPLP